MQPQPVPIPSARGVSRTLRRWWLCRASGSWWWRTTPRAPCGRCSPASREDFRPRIGGVLVSDDHSVDDTYAVGLEVAARRGRAADHGRATAAEPRLRRKPEVRVPMGHRARARHRGDAPRRRAVRARAAGGCGGADRARRGRRRARLPHDGQGWRSSRWHAALQARSATGSSPASRTPSAGWCSREWHSGYRAYCHRRARQHPVRPELRRVRLRHRGASCSSTTPALRIAEVPIPTYYGDEICYVEGIPYAMAVVARRAALPARSRSGSASATPSRSTSTTLRAQARRAVEPQPACSSWIARPPAGRASSTSAAPTGWLARDACAAGHHVTGVDVVASPRSPRTRVDRFVRGRPRRRAARGGPRRRPYDLVVAADVLEHVRDPLRAPAPRSTSVLAPGGRLLVSVPNFGHWYPRLRVLLGRFDYDRRGILDAGHVRFFTRRSFERLLHRSGWHALRRGATGLPFDVADRGGAADGPGLGAQAHDRPDRPDRCARPPDALRLPAPLRPRARSPNRRQPDLTVTRSTRASKRSHSGVGLGAASHAGSRRDRSADGVRATPGARSSPSSSTTSSPFTGSVLRVRS